jgi:hypothetical protein
MESIQLHQKPDNRMSSKFLLQRFLFLMVAIMAAMTFTACSGSIDPDENGGGVSGKRLKSILITESGLTEKGEYTYNSDGSLKRVDWVYSWTSFKPYDIFTNNSDGTHAKWENFNEYGNQVMVYTYNANKKPQKAEGKMYTEYGETSVSYDFIYQDGRLIRHVIIIGGSSTVTYEPAYDSNGRRISGTETHSYAGTRKYTRTYNSDGTLQKVDISNYSVTGTNARTYTFIWENGKTLVNYFDDYGAY